MVASAIWLFHSNSCTRKDAVVLYCIVLYCIVLVDLFSEG